MILTRIYFFLLIFASNFVEDFIPEKIRYYVGFLFLMKVIKSHWSAYIIYPLYGIFLYLISISFTQFFIPEASISLLIGLCGIQVLYDYKNKNPKSDYIISLLYLSCFTLFNTSFGMLTYQILCIFIAILLLSEQNSFHLLDKGLFKRIIINFSFIALITAILFLFFPRFQSLLPSTNSTRTGEIGHSTEINNSDISELIATNKIAFFAIMPKIDQENLYWRSRVLNYTDGYNWRSTEKSFLKKELQFSGDQVTYDLKYEQNFSGDLITLDVPSKIISSKLRFYHQPNQQTFHTYDFNDKNIITAQSYLNSPETKINNWEIKQYLQVPTFVPKNLKKLLNKINAPTPSLVISKFQQYLKIEGFTYSISPGLMPSLSHFIENKKGFCTHYASLLAIALRHLKIPSRIVSGFQGGEYNNAYAFYTIKSSDAHAWVEYWYQNKWNRIDPTTFIAPTRISELYQFSNRGEIINKVDNNLQFLNQLRFFYENFNIKFSIFLENLDKSYQVSIANKFNLSLNSFYIIGFLSIIASFLMIYFIKNYKPHYVNPIDKLFFKFIRKLEKYDIYIERHHNINDIKEMIQQLPSKQKKIANTIVNFYEITKYSKSNELKKLELNVKKFNA